jgi:hypothetical protein
MAPGSEHWKAGDWEDILGLNGVVDKNREI